MFKVFIESNFDWKCKFLGTKNQLFDTFYYELSEKIFQFWRENSNMSKSKVLSKLNLWTNSFRIFLTPRILDEDSEQDVGGGCSEAAEQHGLLPVEFLDRWLCFSLATECCLSSTVGQIEIGGKIWTRLTPKLHSGLTWLEQRLCSVKWHHRQCRPKNTKNTK